MHWQNIADSLRLELAEYGALLGLFEQQQQSLFARDPEAVLRFSGEIEAQTRILHDCRLCREQATAALAKAHGQPASSTLRSLLPNVEADARPLLEALVNEVNRLLHRVRRISRHNHTLIARTLELHQDLLRQLRPDAFTKTYAPDGRVSLASSAAPALRVAG